MNVWETNTIIIKADKLAHAIYHVTKSLPKPELFGITSQVRRATLSVPLNLIEGYSRFKHKSHLQFLEIAFASLKETHYLIEFCQKEDLIELKAAEKLIGSCNEIEKMLYSKMHTMRSNS